MFQLADTAVIVNLFALNTSDRYWEAPDAFRPERFLDAEGRLNSLGTQVMGFGDGTCGIEFLFVLCK